MKKVTKIFAFAVAICMLFSVTTTTAFAEETITNMTYDEWLAEQENNNTDIEENDLEPVKVTTEENQIQTQSMEYTERVGFRSLDSIFEEKGEIELDDTVSMDNMAENLTDSISVDTEMERTAPTANLIPVIVNEDSLSEGQITTDTRIAFFYNDTDEDGDTIASRYVDGSAVDYIIGTINGGFVEQITDPGTYYLYYQVEDSAGEYSRVVGYSIKVIEAPAKETYQAFEGSFTSEKDSATYDFSIDFSQMDSAAVCLVRKGYVGTNIKVYDENGNQVLNKGTNYRQAKNWGYIDKPSDDVTVCNYTVVATPNSYEDRASDYRIIVGDKNDTELMMSGIENTVLLDQYYESKVNLQNNSYVPNVGEYWYKYKRNSTSVITILSSATDIRFKILNVDTLAVMYDSAKDDDTHKTSFTGSGGWCCAEKARLTTVVGTEYYLVVYCTNPTEGVSLRTGSIATAVGNPVMCAASTKIIPGTSVTATGSGYSSTRTFSVSGDDIPNTAQVRTISLSGTGMSKIKRWRLMAPNKSVWVANESDFYPSINFNFVNDSSSNAKLKGTWSVAFQSSSSSYTFIPSYSVSYYYEYGD